MSEETTNVVAEKESIFRGVCPQGVNPVGWGYYGNKFSHFQKMEEVRDLLPAFKEMYYQERITNKETNMRQIIMKFNEELCFPEGRTFYPYTTNLRFWKKKWDRDIAEKKKDDSYMDDPMQKRLVSAVKTRGTDGYVVPEDSVLEMGTRILAGELLNDALTMLRDDQELEDEMSNNDLMRRKQYIVNVFASTTKLTQGKAQLLLKASQEKRDNAGFMMELIAKATSGELKKDDVETIRSAYDTINGK